MAMGDGGALVARASGGALRCISALFLRRPVCWKMRQMQQGYKPKRRGALQLPHRGPSPVAACWIMLFGCVANRGR